MSETINVNIRMEKDLKERAEYLFSNLGMNMSTALNIFVRQAVRQGKIPFEITTHTDNFYSLENIERIKKSIQSFKDGKTVTKTIKELEEMEYE